MRNPEAWLGVSVALALCLSACSGGGNVGDKADNAEAAKSAGEPAMAPVDRAIVPSPVDLDGLWLPTGNGRLAFSTAPVLTPAGRAAFASNKALLVKGGDPLGACLPPSPARLMTISQPIAFSVNEDALTQEFQLQRLVRFVYLTDRYAINSDPTFVGEAHGHWDARALVIETKNFKPGGWLDATGLPHGAKLVVRERIEKTGVDTLVDHLVIEDPDNFAQPLRADVELRRIADTGLREDVCVERTGLHK